MDLVILLTIVAIVLATFFFLQRKGRKLKFPPGPKGYPFFGNSLEVDFANLHFKLDEWFKQYGDIYLVKIFGRDLYVLNTGEVNREAFLEEPNATILADRIKGMVGKDFHYNFHDISFSGQTKETIRRRKLGFRLMKSYGEGMVKIEQCIHEELEVIIEPLMQKETQRANMEEIVDQFVCGVLCALMMGRRYDVKNELIKTMCAFDHHLTDMMNPGTDMLLDWFPLLKKVPWKVGADYRNTKIAQNKFFEVLLREMNAYPDGKGIVYDLFNAKYEDLDKNGQQWLYDDDIYGILSNFVSAAFLTTKGSLLSFILCMLDHPEVQKKLQNEVDTIVDAERLPNLADRKQMPYTEAVINETLRLISHVPLSVPHCALRDTKLRGFDIPKGTTVISNLWSVHHNEKVWKSPYEFNPDRFLDSDGDLLSYEREAMKNCIPFGLGKRSCIGEVFDKGRLFLFVSTMMKYFTFVPDDVIPQKKFHPNNLKPGIVRVPNGFFCKMEKRFK